MPIQKCEVYDTNVIELLLRHPGVCDTDKGSLRKYKKRHINGNTVQVIYDYSDGANREMKKGRIYPQPFLGLATFPREVRAALAATHYDEIDMENSQPVLLAQIGKKEGLLMASLDEYIDKRTEVLAEIQKNGNMTRSEAKDICIAVAFGGYREEHPLLPKIKAELDILADIICKKYPEYFILAKKSKEAKGKRSNLPASALAQYAQDLETKILLIIEAFLESKGYSMDVLQHDGGDVRKKDGQSIPMTLLREAEGVVLEKSGFKVTLAIKPLTHTFDFTPSSNDTMVPKAILISDGWAAEQFVDIAGDKLRLVGNELYCQMDDGSWDFGDWGIRRLINQCKKQLVWKQMNDVGFVNIFDYGSDVVHIAKLIKQTYMEAKTGKLPIQFAYTDLDADGEDHVAAVQQFQALLKMVCGNDNSLYQYVLRWLAHIIQKPYELPGVMLILSGGKGVGKDTIFDFLFAHVFGKKSSQNYTSNKQFFEKHDTGRQGKLLVKLEEADRKYCLDNASDLKAMVTGSDATFNPKCEKAITIPNYCRFVFTTNGGNPVDFGDGERRFNILPCSAEKKGDLAYWMTVRETLFNDQAGLAVAKFLEAVDLTGFNVRQLPENEYQDAVVDTEIKAEQRYIEQWDGQKILASEMYRAYRNFCVENSMLHAENVLSFSKKLLPFKRDNIIDNKRTNKGIVYWKVGIQQTPDE